MQIKGISKREKKTQNKPNKTNHPKNQPRQNQAKPNKIPTFKPLYETEKQEIQLISTVLIQNTFCGASPKSSGGLSCKSLG